MHSNELLPQFPHHDSTARQAAHLIAQEVGTQPCFSLPPNQHLASPAPPQHPPATLFPSCCLQAPPLPCSFLFPFLRGTCGQQLTLSQEGPGAAGKCG